MSSPTPYPAPYDLIFSLLEPSGLLAGAAFAILAPQSFYSAYLGSGWFGDSTTGGRAGNKAALTASGMGSCMCIIGVLSALVLPKLAKTLKGQPEQHEQVLRSYLGALAVGDVAHIVVTLLYAPPEVRFHPSTWTVLLWGNIVGTAMPAVARIAWFSGVGREVFTGGAKGKGKGKAAKKTKDATRPAGYGSVGSDN